MKEGGVSFELGELQRLGAVDHGFEEAGDGNLGMGQADARGQHVAGVAADVGDHEQASLNIDHGAVCPVAGVAAKGTSALQRPV